jgi:hypothetical protein
MHALAACGSFVAEQQSVRKDPDGLPAVRQLEETGAQAPVFFRLYQSASYSLQNFTMWKIFLRRKKSCCKAQEALLRDGKSRFSMRNDRYKQLI